MGVNVADAGIGVHASGGTRTPSMWAGIENGPGGVSYHRHLDLGTVSHAKALCKEAATSETAMVAAMTTAEASWFNALPADYRAAIVADGAAWHSAGYCW